MRKIFRDFDSFYKRKFIKNLYTSIFSGITTILLLIIPFFIPMRRLLGSFIFDLFARLFVTYSFCSMFYFVSHLDQFYTKFYSGIIVTTTQSPDGIKRVINILAATFVGFCGYLFFHLSLDSFYPMPMEWNIAISITIGIFLFLPMISQYDKR